MIDSLLMQEARSKIDAALQAVGKELGIVIKCGRATFTSTNATMKLEFSAIGDSGEVISREAEEFKRCARLFGLDPSMLNQTFHINGKDYKVVGMSPRSRRYPVIVEHFGKKYKMTASAINNAAH